MNTATQPELSLQNHVHSQPWDTEVQAAAKALPHAEKEAERIMDFIEARGMAGATPGMYLQATEGNEERIMAVRRRFYDLRDAKRIKYHPDGLKVKNAAGTLCKLWVPGVDPNAGRSKYRVALARIDELEKALLVAMQHLNELSVQLKLRSV